MTPEEQFVKWDDELVWRLSVMNLTAEKIRAMSMEEYAQVRQELLGVSKKGWNLTGPAPGTQLPLWSTADLVDEARR